MKMHHWANAPETHPWVSTCGNKTEGDDAYRHWDEVDCEDCLATRTPCSLGKHGCDCKPDEGEVVPELLDMIERVQGRTDDPVNHPEHYKWLPFEVIEITEHFNFTLGNALKYIMRADHKGKPVEDLRKAIWYLERDIANREKDAVD